jgi:hypothetical protein
MTGGQVIEVANYDRWPNMTGGQVIEVANFTVLTVPVSSIVPKVYYHIRTAHQQAHIIH